MATPTLPPDPTDPITPARFAAALPDLPLASLHLKVLELRNALRHLADSNAQLQPFADGTATARDSRAPVPGLPDPDCADAIAENECVMARMRERIALVRREVSRRGASWAEFEEGGGAALEPGEEGEGEEGGAAAAAAAATPLTNGVHDRGERDAATSGSTTTNNTTSTSTSTTGNPWTDGTFQMGTIRNGELHMDAVPPQRPNGVDTNNTTAAPVRAQQQASSGGRLTDEELRRLLEVRLAEDMEDDDEGGLHL